MASWITLGLKFLEIGALGFGGGFGMIPLMKSATLSHHWLSSRAFDQAIALGQITPGPVAISAAFIGDRVSGLPGAVIATVAVFLPSLVIMFLLTKGYHRIRRIPGLNFFLGIILAGVTGLILGVTWDLGRDVLHSFAAWALALGVFLLAWRAKIPYWLLILLAGGVGALWLRG